MVYSARWIGFGLSYSLARTVVHFFPSSAVVTAPYPVNTKIQVLSTAFGEQSVILEGARLHQPDGVRLEAAFPAITEGPGIYAIIVEVTGAAQRIDLSASQCIIEIITANGKIRFRPISTTMQDGTKGTAETTTCIAYGDNGIKSSMVFVNTSQKPFEISGISEGTEIIAAGGVTECPLNPYFFESGISYQSERDVHNMALLRLPSGILNNEICAFLMERDAATDRVLTINRIDLM